MSRVERARAENARTSATLCEIWKARCDALAGDLELARAAHEAMRRELFRVRDEARLAGERADASAREVEDARREARGGALAREAAEAAARTAARVTEREVEARREVEERCEVMRGEMARELEAMDVERAETRELLDSERRRRDGAERRREKAEKGMKALRDEMESRERELVSELERERLVRGRLEEERLEFEADRRRFRDFEQMLSAEKIKVVEAHSANRLAQDALREQLVKAENEVLSLRRTMESRSTEMANAVRRLNEELAVQHDIVERGMSARVDALRDAFDEEIARARERATVMIEAARKKEAAANERVKQMELTVARAEKISREALGKLKTVSAATSEAERECEQLRASLHSMGEINAKLTRRIIDGEPFVLDEENRASGGRQPTEITINTPSPSSERSRTLKPARFNVNEIRTIHRELEAELAKLRVEHDAIAREMSESAASDGEMLARALEDAQERMEAKARQVKLLNSTIRNATP